MFSDSNYVWMANEKGLYKFNNLAIKNYDKEFNINILKVSTEEDSVLFEGSFYEYRDSVPYLTINQADNLKPELTYQNNKVVFEYAALFYEEENKSEYSYRLIGATDKWSKWTTETKFPFTNLSPGDYRFEIRARNIYGTISNITTYEFTILPPWYMTIWAYILFFFAAVGLVWLIVKLNIRRLQLDKIKLEGIIDERTTEIRMKNLVLEQQKEEITAQRDEIEIQKNQVTLQKDQIEEQKKNITDSILYASKIQEALLPPESVLNELLPEHFILWKPRDIVSGDFYWASKKNNKTILVAADCTGHGVPGAFMSMLGISYLNEIMNKFEDIRANEILNELKASVKTALRQTGKINETKDGMDMSLCMMDFDTMEMEFAGAYNSLLLIRDGEVIKYEADRMPIGIYIKERDSFTNHLIEMKKGDNFYIHSDGFVDQFGGEKGHKLMSKRFKELLLEHHKKPAAEQKAALETFLINWLSHKNEYGASYDQLDDIMVIGITI
jgi:serine phosphatase RsbU (regulator of sigma subunit)